MNSLVNNWVFGEVSPKLGGRFDLAMHSQGCETLLNFRPMLQGGITRRPPLKHISETIQSRIIPFTLSSGESFLIELSHKKLRVWKEQLGVLKPARFLPSNKDYLDTDYLASDIWTIQYAQYYDRLYLMHKSYMQSVLQYSSNSFSFGPFNLSTDNGEPLGKSTNNYPGVVAICQNKLWVASTILQPYATWVSRPPYDGSNNHHNFMTFDRVSSTTEVLRDPSQWPYTTNEKGEQIIDFSDSSKFVEEVEETDEVVTAKCAMELELASGRNDTIMWIAGMDNIFIGTEANEWALPFDIDPTKQAASLQSSLGSLSIQPAVLHDGLFFLQRGNRLREFSRSQNGAIANDLSYTADHMLSVGVMQIASLKNPDPMLFCLLSDGSLAVLSYDKLSGMQGWSRWTTQGQFISIAAREDNTGQVMHVVVKRDTRYFIEYFDFSESSVFSDRAGEPLMGDLDYQSLMVGNRFDLASDSGSTIGKSKKVKEVWVRSLDSGRVSTGVEERYMQQSSKAVGSEDFRIPIAGGARKELKIRLEAVGSDPLTLLAMAFDVEVNG